MTEAEFGKAWAKMARKEGHTGRIPGGGNKGGIRLAMSAEERARIADLRDKGLSIAEIAKAIKRATGSVSRVLSEGPQ